jgi:hypothetical protein
MAASSTIMDDDRKRLHIQDTGNTAVVQYAVEDLLNLQHRLRKDPTVAIVEPGMELLEKIFAEVLPDPSSWANFLVGLNSHGVWKLPKELLQHVGKTGGMKSMPKWPRQGGLANCLNAKQKHLHIIYPKKHQSPSAMAVSVAPPTET